MEAVLETLKTWVDKAWAWLEPFWESFWKLEWSEEIAIGLLVTFDCRAGRMAVQGEG